MKGNYKFIPFVRSRFEDSEMMKRSSELRKEMYERRTIRSYSSDSFPIEILEECIMAASSAPSGANKQPWTYCIVSNPELKRKIRLGAEKEEYENYHGRMGEEWLKDLAPLGTDEHKPFLEDAPYLIVLFKRAFEIVEGEKRKNYYVNESIGLSAGMLLYALHHAGLSTLTHTPSPMNFLIDLLDRPSNERPFLLIPVGFPAEGATVPEITKKTLDEVVIKY